MPELDRPRSAKLFDGGGAQEEGGKDHGGAQAAAEEHHWISCMVGTCVPTRSGLRREQTSVQRAHRHRGHPLCQHGHCHRPQNQDRGNPLPSSSISLRGCGDHWPTRFKLRQRPRRELWGQETGIPQPNWIARVQGDEAGLVTASELAQRNHQTHVPPYPAGRSYVTDLWRRQNTWGWFMDYVIHKDEMDDNGKSTMDGRNLELFTDWRILEESVNQSCLHTVGDKRLAIDLSGVRQQIWRLQGEEVGDPLLTDHLSADGTTTLTWVNTEKMAADSLTKSMKPKTLTQVMAGEWMGLTPTKNNDCEKNDHMAHWRSNPSCSMSWLGPSTFDHPCRMAQAPRNLPQWKQAPEDLHALAFSLVFWPPIPHKGLLPTWWRLEPHEHFEKYFEQGPHEPAIYWEDVSSTSTRCSFQSLTVDIPCQEWRMTHQECREIY